MKIKLHNLRVYAFHGVHSTERQIGTWFRIDLEGNLPEDKLIDYVEIYQLLLQEMRDTQLYLETVVRNLGRKLLEKYPYFRSLSIRLCKAKPPLKGLENGYFCVEFCFPEPKI